VGVRGAVTEEERELEGVLEGEAPRVMEAVGDWEGEAVRVFVLVLLVLGVREGVPVEEGVVEPVPVGEGVLEGVVGGAATKSNE
jgi:hypothetical protein